jgi:hypothetical protein
MPSGPLCISVFGCKNPFDRATVRRSIGMSNLVHNEQVKLAATFWNNLGVAALLGVFLVPAFYTRHTILQQAISIGVGCGGDRPADPRPPLAAAVAGLNSPTFSQSHPSSG